LTWFTPLSSTSEAIPLEKYAYSLSGIPSTMPFLEKWVFNEHQKCSGYITLLKIPD